MLLTADELIEKNDLKTIVDFAIETNRTISSGETELDRVKTFLLEKADDLKPPEKKAVELKGNLGSVTVTQGAATPRTRSGVDLLACLPNFPEEVAKLFVERRVVDFAPNFEARLAELSPRDQMMVRNLIELVPPTPEVNFPE